MNSTLKAIDLNSIFNECRQCGSCCRQYRKITLQSSEVEFIKKMGGHVGVDISLSEIRKSGIDKARRDAEHRGKIFMVHPDDKGCVFLEKRNDKCFCKIYHYRPQACKGFRCNVADDSMLNLISSDAYLLLGQNSFGLPLEKK